MTRKQVMQALTKLEQPHEADSKELEVRVTTMHGVLFEGEVHDPEDGLLRIDGALKVAFIKLESIIAIEG